jgi:hypothetical protein
MGTGKVTQRDGLGLVALMSTAAVVDHQEYPGEGQEENPHQEYALEESKGSAPSLWRALVNLRMLLPYVGKLLPLLDGNLSTALAPPVAPKPDFSEFHQSLEHVNRGFLDLQAGNRDLKTHVQEHSVQLKRIDDQLIRLRESTERNTMEHQELVEDLRSASKMVRGLSTAMIVMMIVIVAMVAFMLLHSSH